MPENALRNGLRFIPKFTEPRTTPFHPTKPPTENPEGKSNKMRIAINLLRKPLGVMLGAAALMLNAESLPKELQLRQDGTLAISGVQSNVTVHGENWNGFNRKDWKNAAVEKKDGAVTTTASAILGKSVLKLKEIITPLQPNEFSVETDVRSDEPTQFNGVYRSFTFPRGRGAVTVDGKLIEVPAELGKNKILYRGSPKEVVLRGIGNCVLTVSGINNAVEIWDNRAFKAETVGVRLYFSPRQGTLEHTSQKLIVKLDKFPEKPLDLTALANRAFRDETADDAQGGWTDQGPDCDLGMFRPAPVSVMGLRFDVIDPAKNGGRAVTAVGGPERGGVPEELTLTLPAGTRGGALNLLHSAGWTPAGKFAELEFTMADGSSSKLDVNARRDGGDWVNPRNYDNGYVAWKGDRPGAKVGMYVSSFPLPKGEVKSVTFRATRKQAIWLLIAASLTPEQIYFPDAGDQPDVIRAGKEWTPLTFHNRPVAGSPMDFSFLLDAPAGKYGYVQVRPDGTLAFEKAPDRRFRVHGINLCQSANFPSREMAEEMADILARFGFNCVRFHHHDGSLNDPDAPDSTTLDAETLDRLDYFVAALKKRGIYIPTDFYTSRKFKPGDGLWENVSPKAQFPLNPRALENWKTFVRNWMTHRNPYTGLTWAEDPALLVVNLVNEDNLESRLWQENPDTYQHYKKAFDAWKKENGCPDAEAVVGDRDFFRYVVDLQNRSLAEMKRFAREELGMKALLTSLNHQSAVHLTDMRDRFDLTDNHLYFCHPGFVGKPWASKTTHTQSSPISGMATLPRALMASRVEGKPFWVTEFNYCNPNQHRSAGGPLIGSYAALQDWDGIFRFCYSHNIKRIEKPALGGTFESAGDPIMQLSDRIAAAMFLRGDVQPARESFSIAVNPDDKELGASTTFPVNFQLLGLVGRIGSHVAGKALPAGTVNVGDGGDLSKLGGASELLNEVQQKRIARSATGEILLDGDKNTFIVRTPLSESVSLPDGELATGGVLAVKGVNTFCSVTAISLDRKPLAESRSILLLHMTNTAGSENRFLDKAHTMMDSWGKLPLLVRRGKAVVTLNVAKGEPLKVQALSADGAVLGDVAVKGNTFTAATDLFPEGVMAYHITR